jgi:hypothetical protein
MGVRIPARQYCRRRLSARHLPASLYPPTSALPPESPFSVPSPSPLLARRAGNPAARREEVRAVRQRRGGCRVHRHGGGVRGRPAPVSQHTPPTPETRAARAVKARPLTPGLPPAFLGCGPCHWSPGRGRRAGPAGEAQGVRRRGCGRPGPYGLQGRSHSCTGLARGTRKAPGPRRCRAPGPHPKYRAAASSERGPGTAERSHGNRPFPAGEAQLLAPYSPLPPAGPSPLCIPPVQDIWWRRSEADAVASYAATTLAPEAQLLAAEGYQGPGLACLDRIAADGEGEGPWLGGGSRLTIADIWWVPGRRGRGAVLWGHDSTVRGAHLSPLAQRLALHDRPCK